MGGRLQNGLAAESNVAASSRVVQLSSLTITERIVDCWLVWVARLMFVVWLPCAICGQQS